MSAQSTYFSTLIALFAAFARSHAQHAQQAAAATVLFTDFLRATPQSDDWHLNTFKRFVDSQAAPQSYDKASQELVAQWLQQYPPFQTNVALQHYLLALKADKCSDSTIKNYRSDIGQFLQFVGQEALELAFQKPKVVAFLRYQREKGLKRTSVRRKLVSITQFALWTQQQGYLTSSASWTQDLTAALESVDWEQQLTEPVSPPIQAEQYQLWTIPLEEVASAELTFPTQLSPEKPARSNQELKSRLKSNLLALRQRFAVPRQLSTPKWTGYVTSFMLAIFLSGGGYLAYQQFGTQADPSLAYPTSLTRPNRTLSFQGRLTDTARNPITTATDMRFRLYDSGPSTSGGTLLWDSGTCSIIPDQDGIFSTGLGDACGSEITQDVFTENSNVWLQVEIDNGVTWEVLDPRQGIKTVPYALNSETVQGYPASASAVENTILVMDNNGDVVLGNTSPTLRSTGDSFTIEAQTLTLQTASGSDGDILLSPDGIGQVFVNSDLDVSGFVTAPGATLSANYADGTALITRGGPSGTANIQEWQNAAGSVLAAIDRRGALGVGTSTPTSLLHISGATTGKALAIFNETGDQDIITASTSGVTRLRITNTGHIHGERFVDNSDNSYYLDPAAANTSLLVAGNIGIGTTAASYRLDVSGAINLTSALYANGSAGNSGYLLTSSGGGAMTWTDPNSLGGAGTSYWDIAAGALFSKNSTLDLLVGGTATESAKFAVFNINSGTPTASVSAGVAGGTYLTASGTLSTTALQNVTIGSNTTGDVILNPSRNVGIGTISPEYKLDVSGAARISALNAGGIVKAAAGTGLLEIATAGTDYENPLTFSNGLTRTTNTVTLGGTLTQNTSIAQNDFNFNLTGNGNVGIGTSAPITKLHLTNDGLTPVGKATLIIDQYENQDIFTASASGTTRSRLANNGYFYAERFADNSNSNYYLDPAASGTSLVTAGNIGIGTTSTSGTRIVAYTSTNNYGYEHTDGTRQLSSYVGTDGTYWGSRSNDPLHFYINDGVSTPALSVATTNNIGIGTTSPSYKLEVIGTGRFSGALTLSSLGSGSTNTVITHSSGTLQQRTIDSRVWGSSLVDGSGSSNYVARWSDSDTLTTGVLFDNGTNVGIGTTSPAQKLAVIGSIDASVQFLGQASDSVSAPSFSWTGDTNVGIYRPTTDTIGFTTAGSEKMRLTSGGNLGIGTTSPSYELETSGSIYANGGWLRVAGSQGLYFQTYGGGWNMTDTTWIRTYGNKSIYQNSGIMRTDGTLQVGSSGANLNINSSGASISNSSGYYTLNVNMTGNGPGSVLVQGNGSGDASYSNLYLSRTSSNRQWLFSYRTATDGIELYWTPDNSNFTRAFHFRTTGSPIFTLPSSGSTSVCRSGGELMTCTSLSKFKDNQENLSLGLDTIMQLRPVEYDWNINDRQHDLGFIAEEVAAISPLLAQYEPDGRLSGVKYHHLTALLTKGIQEQQGYINKHATKIKQLEAIRFTDSGQVALITTPNDSYQVVTSKGIQDTILAAAQVLAAKITAGAMHTQELLVSRTATITNLQVSTLLVGNQTLRDLITTTVAELQQEQQLVSPAVNLNPASNSGEMRVDTLVVAGESLLGTLVTNNIDAQTITATEIASETSMLGELLADSASVSGELAAQGVTTQQLNATSSRITHLEARVAELQHVKAQTAELMEATVSGTLYANNIYDFENKIASSFEQPGLVDILKQKLSPTQDAPATSTTQPVHESLATANFAASSSADLNLTLADLSVSVEDVTLTAQALFLEQYFKVNGAAYVADSLGVGATLFVGGGTTIADGSIGYTAPAGKDQIFAIQPSGKGTISLLAGLMTLSDSGLVAINGDLEIAGSVKVADTLLTSLVQPADFGNPFQVQVAGVSSQDQTVRESRFEIINEIGTPVATISAQGRAAFADGIEIGAEKLAADGENPEVSTSKSSGKATIPAGSSEITIRTDRIKQDTLIYVTPVGSTQNQVLYVKSQQAQSNETEGKFVVGFDAALEEQVKFNWWLVN